MIKNYKITKRRLICLLFLPIFLLFPAFGIAQVHTVSKGDTIYKISQWYNVNQFALRYNNNLWADTKNIGQQLNIPVRYTVRKWDNLSLVGKKFGADVSGIRGINQLSSDMIYPGQVLYIPYKSNNYTAWGATGQYNNYSVSRGGAPISMGDFDLLARIITAESDSESYTTQVAVGATILNRVDSPLFPNSIPGVVYQVDQTGRYQFEPVLNGWINNPASESGKNAARDALNGWDPTNGALYFFESWVPNQFLQSRPVSTVLDAFTFTY
jgi:LysM repeat protein